MTRRLALIALAVVAPALLVASAAWAYFSATGSGSGVAAVGTLAAPSSVTGDVTVGWTGVSAPGAGTVAYVVARTPSPSGTPDDVCGTASAPVTTTSCTDTPVHAGTYAYVVTAHYRSWTATSAASEDVVVDSQSTSTSLTLSSASATYGSEHLVTSTVAVTSATGIAPTGTVTVTAGGVDLCTVILPATSCSAAAPDTALAASATPYAVTASYPGDAEYTGSTSADQDLTVARDSTTTTVAAVADTVTTGYEDTTLLTATVSTANDETLPTGTEQVTIAAGSPDVGTTSCVATLLQAPDGGQGSCTIGATALDASAMPYALATAYGGDTDLVGSTSTTGPTLTVTSAPVIPTTALPDATRTQVDYSEYLTVDGGSPVVDWSLVSGALPSGLTLDPTSGEIAGDVDADASTGTFTVRVVDRSGASTDATLTLTVDDPPVITTTSLAPAVAGGAFYAQALAATGGAGPLAWSRDVGLLPRGLHLDPVTGVISGNLDPMATSGSITVTVTDSNGVPDATDATLPVTVTPVLVQQKRLTSWNIDTNLLTMALSEPVAAGDTLVLSLAQPCATKHGIHAASSVLSASWDGAPFVDALTTGCSGTGDAELWYLQGTGSATGSAATTVTVHLGATAAVSLLNVSEYTGVGGLDPGSGACRGASGTSTSVAPGTASPSGPGDLVVTSAFVANPSSGDLATLPAPFGFGPLNLLAPYTGFAALRVDPTSAAVPYTYPQSASGPWAAVQCAFSRNP